MDPVSSSNVISARGAPPVSSSSSGTATMNIAMTLYGDSMIPFTSDKQFAAASSLAGVRRYCAPPPPTYHTHNSCR